MVELLEKEQAVVKTIRNADWTAFLLKFLPTKDGRGGTHEHHPAHRHHQTGVATQQEADAKAVDKDSEYPFNSFVTSTSLL